MSQTLARKMAPLAVRVSALTPRRRMAVAFLAGALATLALAPFNLTPVLLVSFTCLVWLIDASADRQQPRRHAAAIGWWFGFGYHLAGIHWIGFAFMVDAGAHAWMIPIVAIAMPGGLALFSALGGLMARMLFDRTPGPERIVGFAVLWVLLEWARGTILTGFPWNLAGYTWISVLPVAQAAALVGIYGLTFLTLIFACAPAAFAKRSQGAFVGDPQGWRYCGFAFGCFIVLGLWGAARLASANDASVEGMYLRLVQPSISQKEKWLPENRQDIFAQYLQYTEQGSPDEQSEQSEQEGAAVTHVIWPESALPFLIDRQPRALEAIGRALGPSRVLLAGAARMTQSASSQGPGAARQFFNSVHVIDGSGQILATYDKYHLVPFGEYVPLPRLAGWIGLRQLAQSQGGFVSGPGPRTLEVPGAGRVMPLVCYEAIFPGRISQVVEQRPDWLLNVTNDAWFGTTTGPQQHFTQSRFRAIEEGLPLVRAANSGISGIIDGYGRTRGTLGLGEAGVLEGPLPVALAPTPYARLGNRLFWLLVIGAGLWVAALASMKAGARRRPGS
jgi:apolipoprotein N-acyltransferase